THCGIVGRYILAFESLNLISRDTDEHPDAKSAQLPLPDELADHALAAFPRAGQRCNGEGPLNAHRTSPAPGGGRHGVRAMPLFGRCRFAARAAGPTAKPERPDLPSSPSLPIEQHLIGAGYYARSVMR